MKINVLGTDYEVVLDAKEEDYPNLQYGDGYCDFTIKKIVVTEMKNEDNDVANLEYYQQKVIRHEIVHAFMYESGLDVCSEWGRDETLIDWIAIQSPKMTKLFGELYSEDNSFKQVNVALEYDQEGHVQFIKENLNKFVKFK